MKIFKDNYDKGTFYSIMGKFFAEKTYRKLMPYLANDEKTEWIVKTDKNNNVLGFISFVEKKDKVNIGYFFVEDIKNKNKVQDEILEKFYKEHLDKDIYVEVEKHFNIEKYLELDFKIYKETTNYYYLERVKSYEII